MFFDKKFLLNGLLFLFSQATILAYVEKTIYIIVPSYNNKDWYERNLKSILLQEYSNYKVIYIDDCSPDGTGYLVEQFLDQYDIYHRVILIKNKERCGALANHWKAVHMVPSEAIVVHCDGDDWFAHTKVLQRVNQEYQDPEVWMTYGQYVNYPSNQLGHCRQTDLSIIENNSWRDSLMLRWSHLRTFYAWLFKRIKLDDFMLKNKFFGVACDNAFMYPMLEMAQHHVRFIPEVLYVYNNETPLNDYKLRLEEHLATARYIQSKECYKPLAKKPSLSKKNLQAGCFIFSFDRPMQLYALLESMQLYVKGINCTTVYYRASNKAFENAYKKVIGDFPEVVFIQQDSEKPYAEFNECVVACIKEMSCNYLMFAVDDMVVKDEIDLYECMSMMKKTHASGFYLRLGSNIQETYLQDLSLSHDKSVPLFCPLDGKYCVWQFRYAKKDWAYPKTVDMTLYKKKTIIKDFEKISFVSPNTLEAQWYGNCDFKNIGISFTNSKVVNIPLNIVQEKSAHIPLNPVRNNFDINYFLKKFNKGFKIDIAPLYKINNTTAHMDYIPSFIERI